MDINETQTDSELIAIYAAVNSLDECRSAMTELRRRHPGVWEGTTASNPNAGHRSMVFAFARETGSPVPTNIAR
jgi:hypothetical protein